jgi:transcriptional regulator with XRE-family HTH domain
VKLGEKIRYLRSVEGTLRGLGREMTQQETVRAITRERKRDTKHETRGSISQSYLSQIESGARPHLTNSTRMLLAKFFGVHPGYLVDDPQGFHTELISDARVQEDQLDLWLIGGAERFSRDPRVSQALLHLARHEDSRKCLVLLDAILDTPHLVDRLLAVLGTAPGPVGSSDASSSRNRAGARDTLGKTFGDTLGDTLDVRAAGVRPTSQTIGRSAPKRREVL